MKHKLLALAFAGIAFASCNKDNDVMPPNGGGGGGTNPALLSVPNSLSFSEAGRSASPVVYTYGYENGKPKSVTVTQNGNTISTVAFTYNQNNTLNGLTYTDANNSANSYTETFSKDGNTITVTRGSNPYSTLTLNNENLVTTEALNGGATNTYTYTNGNHTGVTYGTVTGTISGYTGKGYFSNMSLEPYEEFLMAEYLRKDARAKTLAQNPQEKTFSDSYEMTAVYTPNANGMPAAATTTITQNGTTTISTVATEYKEIEKPKPLNLPKVIVAKTEGYEDGALYHTNIATSDYSFNDDNRLQSISTTVNSHYAGKTTSTFKMLLTFKYYPDGNLQEFTRKDYDADGSNERLMDNYTYTYSGNNIIQNLNNGQIITYKVTSNQIKDITWGECSSELSYTNGNMTRENYSCNGSITSTYEYDSNKNIFANINTNHSPAQAYLILENVYDSITSSNVNNPTEQTQVYDDDLTSETIYTYDYNANRYPGSMSYSYHKGTPNEVKNTVEITYN